MRRPANAAGLSPRAARRDGYALAALLVGLAVMGILTSAVLPVWRQAAQRERELELVFRGEQYVRAIDLYQRVYAGAYPPDVDTLVEQRFLRRRYRDPMVADGEFRIVHQAEASETFGAAAGDRPPAAGLRGGVIGVVSRSEQDAIRIYNGRTKYSEWAFLHVSSSTPAGQVPGSSFEGAPQPGQVPAPPRFGPAPSPGVQRPR